MMNLNQLHKHMIMIKVPEDGMGSQESIASQLCTELSLSTNSFQRRVCLSTRNEMSIPWIDNDT